MFVALETTGPGPNGIFGGILGILTKPKARLETRKVLGAVYGVIIAAEPSRAADWRRVAELAGRYADRVLLPDGIDASPVVSEPAFPRFERLVLLKTAVELIKQTRMPMYRRVAGLIDEDGRYADFLFPLLHHYTAVKVLTGRPGHYSEEADRMMEELGAPVILCEDYSALTDCALIIAPDGIAFCEKLCCPVLSKKPPKTRQESEFITDLTVIPEPELAAACPVGIDQHKFLAALYEYCGVEAASRPAGMVTWRYARAGLGEVAKDVRRAAGGPYGDLGDGGYGIT